TIACVSGSLRERLLCKPFIDPGRVHIVYNGVDVNEFAGRNGRAVRREHGIAEEAILIGALGNMRPAKDFPTLLRTAALLADDRRFVFAIVGEKTEPLYGSLRLLRDELGLRDRVSFWGFRNDAPEVL